MILKNDLLQAFEAIIRSGTVHGAGASLGLTQTAITQRIKALETGLGVTLFLRSRKGMTLTEEGQTLLQYTKASNELLSAYSARLMGEEEPTVALTLIGPTNALSTRIADNLVPIYKKYPSLLLHLRSDDRANRIELLKSGQADLIIVPPDDVPNELDSKPRLFVNENETLIRLFAEGVGFGTLTEDVAKPHLASGDLILLNKGQTLEDPLALAWYPRPQRPRYFDDLIHGIK